jgi:ferrous iron transport protein A
VGIPSGTRKQAAEQETPKSQQVSSPTLHYHFSRGLLGWGILVANSSQLPEGPRAMGAATAKDLEADSLFSLSQAKVGCDFRIRFLNGPACEQLRQLGFCESLQVRKLADGRNLICSVCGTRLALSRELASQVMVAVA